MTTTGQQAVTVAHDITRNPELIWLSPICDDTAHHGEGRTWAAPAPAETCEDCSEPWVEYVRSDLASVSSASAEGWKLVPTTLTADMAGAWQGGGRPFSSDEQAAHSKNWQDSWRRLLAASPEPVPATNRAGEVERLRRALQSLRGTLQGIANAEGDTDLGRRCIAAIGQSRVSRSSATQPATSQEGEDEDAIHDCGNLGWCQAPGCCSRHGTAPTQTPPTLSDDLRGVLEFYADRDGDGYQVDVTNYGLSTEEGEIVRDRGERARAALAQVKAS
ncbi:hypothetical protein [Sphingomonas sp. Leaf226]|uniref:hypothetical protein n=1 Tax=Sphingomonas sp. Leaf226 TaxID=1735691 RepID=UPI000B068EDC|nr:hypothetical protein [Sphingomonas sp. Leaf226]